MRAKKVIAGMISVLALTSMLQFPTVFATEISVDGRNLNPDTNVDGAVDNADLDAVRNGLIGKASVNVDVNCDSTPDAKDLIAMKVFLEKNYGKNTVHSVNNLK